MKRRNLAAVLGELRVTWERARNAALDARSVVGAVGRLEAWAQENLRPVRGRVSGDERLRERVRSLAGEGWCRGAVARKLGVGVATIDLIGREENLKFQPDGRGGKRPGSGRKRSSVPRGRAKE
jgi:hypothetical protein